MANVFIAGLLAQGSGLVAIAATDLRQAGIFVICMILAIGVHEFAHAYTAHKLGDHTPEGQGRLTLNPIAHMDPIGTLALPLILGMGFFGKGLIFGWGRPVETQPRYYTRKVTMRAGMAMVAFAGPLSNLVQAALTLLLILGLTATSVIDKQSLLAGGAMGHPLMVFYYLNLLLFAFNLLPLHPLDGGKVLAWLIGPKYQHVDDFLAQYGWMILLGLVFVLPFVLGINPLGLLFGPFFAAGDWALQKVLLLA